MSAARREHWKALIVDDEELARLIIRELLGAHPEIEVVAECANGMEAVKAVAEHKPNLIFLDVQMPKLTGFDVLELIGTDVPVIFVTAYDQFAMRAFDVHAVDYLLKPISKERFDAAVGRAKERIGAQMPLPEVLSAAARPPPGREGWDARDADSGCETGLRGGPGRLRGAGQCRKKASETADHSRTRSVS